MLDEIKSLYLRNYEALNRIELSKGRLLSNYKILSSRKKMIAPVLKSNAYGHGLVATAKILDTVNAPFFCVDSLYEAYELSKNGIKSKILIMGYVSPKSLATKKLPFSFAVYTLAQLKMIAKYQPHSLLHIFVDTGMHREGFLKEELPLLVRFIKKNNLIIEGIMSHFAESEAPGKKQTREQIADFKNALADVFSMGIIPRFTHIENSSGILHSKELDEIGKVSRSGIGLYGIDPEGKDKRLKPVLEFKSVIAQIKYIKKGEYVGYNFSHRSKKDSVIAVIPAGYNDGVDLGLSNIGFMKVKGVFCPIIGRVSMNITTIDVTCVKGVQVGDSVAIFSRNKNDKNSIANASKIAKTIPYELLVHLTPSTARVVVR